MSVELIQRELSALASLAHEVRESLSGQIGSLADLYVDTLRGDGRLYFAGNGGSAADAQHVAAEYVVRLGRPRRPLPAVALTTDTSVLTACSNDFTFDDVFSRQVEALCGPADLLVLHSTSGSSRNLIRAADVARERGATAAALIGRDGGPLRARVDHAVVVPSDSTSHIQELHLAIEHIVCTLVEQRLGLT